jgi:hypothetical protein
MKAFGLLCVLISVFVTNGLRIPVTPFEREVVNPTAITKLAEEIFDPNSQSKGLILILGFKKQPEKLEHAKGMFDMDYVNLLETFAVKKDE